MNLILIFWIGFLWSKGKCNNNDKPTYTIPFKKSSKNPNFFEIQLNYKTNRLLLPINLQASEILITTNHLYFSKEKYPLFEEKCLLDYSYEETNYFSLYDKRLENVPYLRGTLYIDDCDFQSYIGLGIRNIFLSSLAQSLGFHSQTPFSIFLSDIDKYKTGYLTLGSIEEEVLKKYPYKIFCLSHVNSKSSQYGWYCRIKGLIVGDISSMYEDDPLEVGKKIEINASTKYFKVESLMGMNYQRVNFELTFRYILVPFKAFIYIRNSSDVQKLIGENVCELEHSLEDEEVAVLYCREEGVKKFPDIHFLVGSFSIPFEKEFLFEKVGFDQYMLRVISRLEGREDKDEWIFGQAFFEKYGAVFQPELSAIDFVTNFTRGNNFRVSVDYAPESNETSEENVKGDIKAKIKELSISGILIICIIELIYLIYIKKFKLN